MVIQHNLTAMNSNRMLGVTTSAQAKSTEKLSSGYKINRAADDAAGLSISEKMRKQIRGLSQASLNAQDGISAVQTAEGALNEVQDMLQRANELAVKASNGTMSEDDRSYIQDEIKQLETEIDRVAETTKFNETYLLKGDKMADKEWTASYTSAMTEPTFTKVDAYTKFYGANTTAELTDEEIVEKLEAGERIYTNPMGQVASEHSIANTSGAGAWTNAAVDIDLGAWATGGDLTIGGVTVAQGTEGTAAAILNKLNSDEAFAEKYEASLAGTTLTITAKDNSMSAAQIMADVTGTVATSTDVATKMTVDREAVAIQYTGEENGWGNLYLEGGTTALTEAEAKQALIDGETLYYGGVNQTESTDHSYTEAKGATVTLDLTNWGTTGDKITLNSTDISYAASTMATAEQIAEKINTDAAIKDDYSAEVVDGKLVITALTEGEDAGDLTTDLSAVIVGGTTYIGTGATSANQAKVLSTVTNPTKESYSDNGKGWDNLYAAGGTEKLTVDEAKALVADGKKVYTTAATQTEAVEGVDYNFDDSEAMTFYDANGNKIAANALDNYLDFDSAGNASIKEGKTLYVDEEGTEFGSDPLHSIEDYVTTSDSKIASLKFDLHVGADATEDNQISMEIEAMDATTLGVKDLKVDGKDDTNALNAIETIKAALQKVSTQRSALGAIQNRLEHTIANLDNVVENTTAAESQIRDTDMATEMVKFSNNNILAQAGQAMLAQANQSNQGVLSLLG